MSSEILRRLNPREAQLLRDPTSNVKIRFRFVFEWMLMPRFGGESFPPVILFKIFSKGTNVHYFSGHRLIQSGSQVKAMYLGNNNQAAIDSCSVMGARTYRENIMINEYHHDAFGIYEPYEVGNKLEFVQYLNSLDERPAHLGGRNNGWRELTIARTYVDDVDVVIAFSTQSILYDVGARATSDKGKFVSKYVFKKTDKIDLISNWAAYPSDRVSCLREQGQEPQQKSRCLKRWMKTLILKKSLGCSLNGRHIYRLIS